MEDFEALLSAERINAERFVRFHISARADAEDVLQEIYLTAYRKFPQLKNPAAFKPWLLAIARNKCNDYFRQKAAQLEIPIADLAEFVPAASRMGITAADTVRDTLEKLGDKDRQMLYLYFWKELPQSDIAKLLGIPLGTVKSRLHTAKRNFKQNYPYHPTKGETDMKNLPQIMPTYTIEKLDAPPFPCRWEEMQGWFIIPRLGEKLTWAMYDFPERMRTNYCEIQVVGQAEVHGIQGVEIKAIQYGQGDDRDSGFEDSMEHRFVAQLTASHSRYLAEMHTENGIRKCYTFLDGEAFLNNWGFGPDNCGNEVDLRPKGLICREGNSLTCPLTREVLDVVGRYAVTINGKSYDTLCVMDIELYNEAVATEQFVDAQGRTVLWRRFNRDDWAIDRFGGKPWSEKLPDNERITINGQTYVHWYDCISDYIM